MYYQSVRHEDSFLVTLTVSLYSLTYWLILSNNLPTLTVQQVVRKCEKGDSSYNSVTLDFLEFPYKSILSYYVRKLLVTLGPIFGFYLINKEKLSWVKAEKSESFISLENPQIKLNLRMEVVVLIWNMSVLHYNLIKVEEKMSACASVLV